MPILGYFLRIHSLPDSPNTYHIARILVTLRPQCVMYALGDEEKVLTVVFDNMSEIIHNSNCPKSDNY